MTPLMFALGMMANSLLELRSSLQAGVGYADQAPVSLQIAPDSTILEAIALCESDNNPEARNASSTAKGRFQFLDSTWKHYGKMLWGDDWTKKNVLDWNDNTELAEYAFKLNGTADWQESKYCWSK